MRFGNQKRRTKRRTPSRRSASRPTVNKDFTDIRDVLAPSWDEYFRLVNRLLPQIESDFRPNFVVGLMTGGLFPAAAIAKYCGVPMAALAAQSYYQGTAGQYDRQGKVKIGSGLAVINPDISGRILLVDDLADSGKTFQYCRDWLRNAYGSAIAEIRTAAIWFKIRSIVVPDYLVVTVAPDEDGNFPWIHQPIDAYEERMPI